MFVQIQTGRHCIRFSNAWRLSLRKSYRCIIIVSVYLRLPYGNGNVYLKFTRICVHHILLNSVDKPIIVCDPRGRTRRVFFLLSYVGRRASLTQLNRFSYRTALYTRKYMSGYIPTVFSLWVYVARGPKCLLHFSWDIFKYMMFAVNRVGLKNVYCY